MAKKDSVEVLDMKIRLLKEARKIISRKDQKYICYALSSAARSMDWSILKWGVYEKLTDYISKALGRHAYYQDWVKTNNKRLNLELDADSLRKYRLQWIDWMLCCLEEDLVAKKAKNSA
jgi:hypothetical protein